MVVAARFECGEPAAEAGELIRRQLGNGFGDFFDFHLRSTAPLRGMVLVRLLSHSMRLYRRLLNFAHVSVVYSSNLPILLGDRDRVPTGFRNNATVAGISLPIDASAFLEAFGFGDRHCSSH